MTFRGQLALGHAAALALTAAMALTSVLALRMVSRNEHHLVYELSAETDAMNRLRLEAEQMIATSRGYLLTGNLSYLERYEAAEQTVDETLHDLEQQSLDQVARLRLVAVQRSFVSYRITTEVAERARAGSDADALVPFFGETLQPRREELQHSIHALVAYQQAERDRLFDRAQNGAEYAEVVVLIAAASVIFLGIGLAGFAIAKLTMQYERIGAARRAAEIAIASRDEVLSMVSHDLRNPLSSIGLATAMLEDEQSDDSQQRQFRVIRNSIQRMENMIEAQLEADRFDGSIVLHRDLCSSVDIVDTVAELFRDRAIERDIQLVTQAMPVRLVVDRERVIEILSNLVGNALDYTPAAGTITVTARAERGRVRFAVADTGEGIPTAQLPFVFERHWRGDRRSKKGFGLGLYICKRLVDAHGGVIGVDSILGRGTTFWFTIAAAYN